MGTLQSGKSPGQRVDAGNAVLDRASSADARSVKKRLDAFRSAHRAFSSGHAVAEKASAALIAQQRTIGELDAVQDDAVEAWASARTGAGAKRLQPFADLKGPSASDIKGMGDRAEAELIVKLAAKDKKHPDAKVKKTAAAADAAARAVLKASDPIKALTRTRDAAVSARDAIGIRWEKAFASLKRGARAAEDDGAVGVFASLFDAPTAAPKAKKVKIAPAPAATSASNGAPS